MTLCCFSDHKRWWVSLIIMVLQDHRALVNFKIARFHVNLIISWAYLRFPIDKRLQRPLVLSVDFSLLLPLGFPNNAFLNNSSKL